MLVWEERGDVWGVLWGELGFGGFVVVMERGRGDIM